MNFGLSLSLGRIRGIEIRVHWSWLIILGLVTAAASGLFGEYNEEWSEEQRVAAALVASVLFFVSVLAHELSHAFVALAYGMRVPSITLFILGGVASLADEAETAAEEFRVALAGPLMSFLLAGIAGLVWLAIRHEPISVVPGYLAVMNLALGVFNLLPGFPLDGGRVFRSIVWGLTGSRVRATRVAAFGGSMIAYGLIGIGLLAIAAGEVSGVWYILLGLFLRAAVAGSEQTVLIEEALANVHVRAVMRPPPEPVAAGTSLQELVDTRVLTSGDRCYLVGHDSAVIGLLTTSDLAGVPRERWATTRVEEVMVPERDVVVIEPEAPVLEALQRMQEHDIHQMPVIEVGRLVGLVTRGDVLRQIELRQRFGRADESRERDRDRATPVA